MNRRTALALLATLVVGCKKSDADIPEYGSIGAFSLRDQTGKPLSNTDLVGKVWIAAFMFTRCPTICPVLTARMKTIQDRAKAKDIPVHLVSFSVDPDNDTPEVLRAYAEKNGADPERWHFLTGDYETVKTTSIQGFKTALEGKADPSKEHYGILHGSHLILVDAAGRLRGFYSSKDDAEIEKLLNDAARLAK